MKKNSVAEILVQEFIKGLEQWDIPRQQGWISKAQKNFVSTNPYNWFNQLLLSYISGKKGWSNYWGSYKQIKDNWGFKDWEEMYPVRIVFYKEYTKKKDTDWDEELARWFALRYYIVYNLSQTNLEIPEDEEKEMNFTKGEEEQFDYFKEYLEREGLWFIENVGQKACYNITQDRLEIPKKELFKDAENYFATLYHEVAHSTWAEKRLNRKMDVNNTQNYSKEELVAEIGSAIINNELWNKVDKKNTQAYLNWWITFLQNNPKDLISAGKLAYEASKYYLQS